MIVALISFTLCFQRIDSGLFSRITGNLIDNRLVVIRQDTADFRPEFRILFTGIFSVRFNGHSDFLRQNFQMSGFRYCFISLFFRTDKYIHFTGISQRRLFIAPCLAAVCTVGQLCPGFIGKIHFHGVRL